jgi:hypothetical protein
MNLMRRCAFGVAMSFVVAALAGCGGSEASGVPNVGTCTDADEPVVEQIMAGARTDFRPVTPSGRRGAQVAEIELVEAGATRLPAKDRKFGADQVVVLLVWMTFGGEDASGDIQRVQGRVQFALDEDERLLGPVGAFSASAFDLPMPKDPGWLEWGDRLEESDTAETFLGCVGED